jgi:hypothetical protein
MRKVDLLHLSAPPLFLPAGLEEATWRKVFDEPKK